jgi:undecaprenyl pyrophosphate phosphatase UppP
MEESRPATAAPEQTAVQEKPQRKRRRVRVPTSVLVTVLVAGLSVWIAPAFARQWDDRQKARELQAEVADQIGIAAAQTAWGLSRSSNRLVGRRTCSNSESGGSRTGFGSTRGCGRTSPRQS